MTNHANNMINELIETLKNLLETKNKLSEVIKNPKLLLEGLTELKNMIEMDTIKLTVVEQVKLLITNKSINADNSHMLHCVLSGKPGQGKTTVARILAKIWISLDMIKKSSKSSNKTYVELLEKSVIDSDYKINKIIKGLNTQSVIVKELNKNVKNVKKLSRDLRFNIDKLIDIIDVEVEPEIEDKIPFVIATREDMVASYLGQTAPKTKALLERAAGGVLFIDEAYSLYNSDRDSFGEECLNVINEFMSLRSDEIIIIFAGYKDLMMNSIFRVQQGLYRRCMWFFEIKDYSLPALSQIFKKQLESRHWKLEDMNLEKILVKYKHVLKNAGDTEKLVFQVKIAYAEYYFDQTLLNTLNNNIITSQMIVKGIEKLIRNHPVMTIDEPPYHMYT